MGWIELDGPGKGGLRLVGLVHDHTQRPERVVRLYAAAVFFGELAEELAPHVGSGRIEMQLLEDGLHLVLAEDLVFDAGSSELHASGREVLSRIVGELEDVPYRIAVLGHTDAQPISAGLSARYPSNWDLAAARAASWSKDSSTRRGGEASRRCTS